MLASLEAELEHLILDAVDRKAGAAEKLSTHRGKVEAARTAVDELKVAQRLAARLEREDTAERDAQARSGQLAELRSRMADRGKAMATVLEAAATMAKAYGEFIVASEQARAAAPDGTALPDIGVGPNGLCGRSFGPLDRLIAAELWRLAPQRAPDSNAYIALPFAAPITEMHRLKPALTPPALAEFEAADAAVLADIEKQVKQLHAADLTAIETTEVAA
ncbi:hypothetical protein [Bradyrhizobium guangdongense]|uniref:hypothetical protein n=1 Tax=Bradyrhizobium guangdongense TaxID=1325090 RepID=UPI001009B5AC|nr:hypothetical protein [Bradyrhizobium guangdongense]